MLVIDNLLTPPVTVVTPGAAAPTPELPPLPTDIDVLKDEVDRITAVSQDQPIPPGRLPYHVSVTGALQMLYTVTKEVLLGKPPPVLTGVSTAILSAITEMYGSTTFAAFMFEEGCQAVGMSGWIAYNAKEYQVAFDSFSAQDEIIRDANTCLELWRPLMPLTYPGFIRFFKASRAANDAWFVIIVDAMDKAALPLPPTLAVGSRPSNAEIFIDDKDTNTLTPETFKWLSPGTHTITAVLPAAGTKGEMGASQDVVLVAGQKLEISLVLTEAAAPPELPPTAPATLRVSSSPSEGAIFLDGTDTGLLTPETFKLLAPGQHTVLVVVPPRQGWPERRATVTLTLAPGEKRELTLSPTIPTA